MKGQLFVCRLKDTTWPRIKRPEPEEPCKHEWIGQKTTSDPSEPDEWVAYCKHCGAEKQD